MIDNFVERDDAVSLNFGAPSINLFTVEYLGKRIEIKN